VPLEDRIAAEKAAQEAALAAELAKRGISTSNVLVTAAAVRLVSEGDPEDLANYRVDRLECELRLVDTGRADRLEVRYLPDGVFEEIGTTYHPDGSAASMARMSIRPTDWDAFGRALGSIPTPHPAVAEKLDRGARDARQLTADERREHTQAIKEQMQAKRQTNYLHRDNCGDRSDGGGYSWI
jgi:hypothetical protein